MSDTWTCPHHNLTLPRATKTGCPDCLHEITTAPDPETMTPDERRAEMERYGDVITVPVDLTMARISALVGRSVMLHEIGLAWTALVNEAGSDDRGTPLTVDQLIEPLREIGKEPIVIQMPDEDGER